MLARDGGCSDWMEHEELKKDAREEIEIEFGPTALSLLTLSRRKTNLPTQRRRRKHGRY